MIATWILYCLIISASFCLAAYAGEQALSQYRKSVRWVWVASIVGSVVLPLGMLVAPSLMRAMSPVMSADVGSAVYLPALVASPNAAVPADGVNPVVVNTLLAWVWGLSVVFIGLRLLGTYGRLRKEMKAWTPGRILDSPVLLSEDRGPAVIGVRRAVIVMPQWIGELEQRLLRLVFLHEREHQRAGDHRLFALGIAALVTTPWNPIMWWQLKRLRLAIEFDCDRRVLVQGVDPRDYAEALLVVGSRVSGPLLAAAAFAERKPSVERRLRRMTEPLRKLRGPRAILATGIGVMGILFACGSPIPMGPGENEQAEPQASQLNAVELDNTDPAAGPAFIPYDTPPVLDNQADILALMADRNQDLKDAGLEGRVEVWLYLDQRGNPVDHRIKTSSGNARLDATAHGVASRMRFLPAQNEGVATPVWLSQWISFGDQSANSPEGRSQSASEGDSEYPLFIVDGVVQARGTSLEEINALSIDHVKVLSDTEAKAYGSRGQNGVVLITTKSGVER